MKLYYSKGACSLAIRILINELNIPSEFVAVDLKTKKTEAGDDFLKINPKGAVPTIELDNKEILTENAVIHQYLAETHQASHLLPPIGVFERYRTLEMLNFITTELHKGFSPLFNPTIPDAVKAEVFIPALEKKFALMDKVLAKHKFLMGYTYTLPDGYLFVMLVWARNMHINIQGLSNLVRYFKELEKRPSIAKSLQEEGLAQ